MKYFLEVYPEKITLTKYCIIFNFDGHFYYTVKSLIYGLIIYLEFLPYYGNENDNN